MTLLTPEVETVAPSSSQLCLKNCRVKSWPGCCNGCARFVTLKKRQRICIYAGRCMARCISRLDKKRPRSAALRHCDLKDLIIHHHRGHGHTIAKGANLTTMMAEFLGREPGYCRGRGGSMHIADIPGGQFGRHRCRRRRNPHGSGHRAGAANAPLGARFSCPTLATGPRTKGSSTSR